MARNRVRRHIRIRKKVAGSAAMPRLSVFRSLRGMYVQAIDDEKSITLVGLSDKALKTKAKMTKKEKAYELGKAFAKLATEKKITTVVFDRGGNKYHGRVAEFAKGAREGGLIF
jgi:large subunit ribosomal protein L18